MITLIGFGTKSGDVSVRGLTKVKSAANVLVADDDEFVRGELDGVKLTPREDLRRDSLRCERAARDVLARISALKGDTAVCVSGDAAIHPLSRAAATQDIDLEIESAPCTVRGGTMQKNEIAGKNFYHFYDLIAIMDYLMGTDGCPWDRVQTHESIRGNLVEEAYEAVDAIDRRDADNLEEETGDVLLQAVFHAMIAKKEGAFDIDSAVDRLCKKLVFRHPHVFGAVRAADGESALASWEKAKSVEKSHETLSDQLRSIPAAFPQTMRAAKAAKRAARAGIGADIDEEMCCAIAADRLDAMSETAESDLERAIGEVLYTVCNLARLKKVDPEVALKTTVDAYIARCEKIERELDGVSIFDADRDRIDGAVARVMLKERG